MPDTLQAAAEAQLQRIDAIVQESTRAALKWPRRFIVMLSIACVLLLGGIVTTAGLYVNQMSITNTVKAQSTAIQNGGIRGCESDNARALADQQNWDFFIDILAKGDKKPADLAEVKFIKDHIASTDKTRDCVTQYGK